MKRQDRLGPEQAPDARRRVEREGRKSPGQVEADPFADLTMLQGTIGNKAVAQLIASFGAPAFPAASPSGRNDRGPSPDEPPVQRYEHRRQAASAQTDVDARAEFEQGRRAFEAGQYQEALRCFETATQSPGLDPSRMPDLVWNIALTKAHLGDMDGAMTEAMTYGQYSPTRPQSQLLDQIGRIGAQEAGVTSQAPGASAQTDVDARAEFEQGRRAFEAGQYQEALRCFETATQSPGLDPSRMPDLVWNIALAKARLGDGDGAMTAVMTHRSLAAGQEALQLEERVASILAEQ